MADAPIPVDVGWHPDSEQAALAFLPPEPLGEAERAALAQTDPLTGAGEIAERVFVLRCPFNLRLRVSPPGVTPVRFTRIEEEGQISEQALAGLFNQIDRSALRERSMPIVQLSLNLFFVTEEPAALTLTPPFLSPVFREWPGTLVSGRFPVRSWPRVLNAALEWEDRDRDWVLRRGDPLAYVWVQLDDPRKVPRLVEAASTPALMRHFRQISSVIEFGRNVGPMFEEAERRRPARLLTPKQTGTPPWE